MRTQTDASTHRRMVWTGGWRSACGKCGKCGSTIAIGDEVVVQTTEERLTNPIRYDGEIEAVFCALCGPDDAPRREPWEATPLTVLEARSKASKPARRRARR